MKIDPKGLSMPATMDATLTYKALFANLAACEDWGTIKSVQDELDFDLSSSKSSSIECTSSWDAELFKAGKDTGHKN